jgi:hypothetical protein
MLDMFLQCLAIDQDVVQVYSAENIQVWAKGSVDISLKSHRCIYESKEHDQRFKEAMSGRYGCLPDILISYPDENISIMDVNFGNILHYG